MRKDLKNEVFDYENSLRYEAEKVKCELKELKEVREHLKFCWLQNERLNFPEVGASGEEMAEYSRHKTKLEDELRVNRGKIKKLKKLKKKLYKAANDLHEVWKELL